MKSLPSIIALLGLAASASAQSEVVGVDVRGDETFTTTTANYVSDYVSLSPEVRSIYGLDFNASGTTLYGVDNVTLEVLTIDPISGVSTPTGTVVSGSGLTGLTGLTAASDGTTWYLSDYDGAKSNLFVGDILTGLFTFVGICQSNGIMIDISIDANDNLYGVSVSDDSLHSIDTTTGVGTRIGSIGLPADFAQGMDFDPVTGQLYAAIYTGSGAGSFCTLNLTTGQATQVVNTLALDAEMEIAIRPIRIGTPYCAVNLNSTGVAAAIFASGSEVVSANNLTLSAVELPINSFGFFIVSSAQGFVMNPGGSAGNLCLSGSVGRYVGPGQIQNSGAAGAFSLTIDLSMIPTPTGAVAASAGDTYSFQTWFRDSSPAGPTSNFTNGLEILFE
ncbi:MAG: hypothetical protein ACJA2W_000582 [Planctomycetota bacterium]|jgi:hypothetical protein